MYILYILLPIYVVYILYIYIIVAHSLLQNENQQLLDEVRELRDQNGRLLKLASEKEFEINHLNKKRSEERLALAGITQQRPNTGGFTVSLVMRPQRCECFHNCYSFTSRGIGPRGGCSSHQDSRAVQEEQRANC